MKIINFTFLKILISNTKKGKRRCYNVENYHDNLENKCERSLKSRNKEWSNQTGTSVERSNISREVASV